MAYARHLMGSGDLDKQARSVEMVFATHLRKGMPLEEVRAILASAKVIEIEVSVDAGSPSFRFFYVSVEEGREPNFYSALEFGEDDRLRGVHFIPRPDK